MSDATPPTNAVPPLPSELPVLPLRRSVLLPMTVVPLAISRAGSVEAVNRALTGDRMLLVLLQQGDADEVGPTDVLRIGTVAIIRQMSKGPTGLKILMEGVARSSAEFVDAADGALRALLRPLPESSERSIEVDAHVRRLQELFDRALGLSAGLSPELRGLVTSIDDSVAARLCPGEPAGHEGRGQAALARGERPRLQARHRGLGPRPRARAAPAQGQASSHRLSRR